MELNRKTRRWFGVDKLIPEKLKVARCCTFLCTKLCRDCEKSKSGIFGRKELDPKNPACIACVDETYRQVYHEERK